MHHREHRIWKRGRMALRALGLALAFLLIAPMSWADGEVTITHYFGGNLGLAGLEEIFGNFKAETGITVVDSPIGHEDFKAGILVRAAGGNLPDVFSYWAGARTQFVVDAGSLGTIDDMWAEHGLDDVVAKSVADGATMYNGDRYLVPFGYHYAGMFYNTKVMADAGVTEFPTDWDGFLALCENLKSQGITPIALGSMNRWPAQFWFDYLLLRTAGPEYRASLMAGEASYTDDEVQRAMQLWKDLVDAGYFAENANADDWTQASDKVSRGDAAMTLMGTWITGYWNGNGLMAGDDYDFFEFRCRRRRADAVVDGAEWLSRTRDTQRGRRGSWPATRRRRHGAVRSAVAERQRRRKHVHVGDVAGAGGGRQRRHVRVQLRLGHHAAGGGVRPGHVRALHGRPGQLQPAPGRHRSRRQDRIRQLTDSSGEETAFTGLNAVSRPRSGR